LLDEFIKRELRDSKDGFLYILRKGTKWICVFFIDNKNHNTDKRVFILNPEGMK